jgi:hypothetical protein
MLHPCAQGSSSGLRGLLLRVWSLADGLRSPAEIAAAAGIAEDELRDALDVLQHVGLMRAPLLEAQGAGLASAPPPLTAAP